VVVGDFKQFGTKHGKGMEFLMTLGVATKAYTSLLPQQVQMYYR
jgi:hypothetical protein